jgi:membrane-bound lytic murein transglycosylase B
MTGFRLIFAGLVALLLISSTASAATYESWLSGFKQRARQQGISEQTLDIAFRGISPSPRVVELDGKQPERRIGFDEYFAKTVTADRIAIGQRLLRENWNVLKPIEEKYGVQAHYIVSLWGIETSYGKNTGGFDLIQALSTLAWDGRRGEYFEGELIKALKILQGNHVKRQDFKGSWAGAMGQVQFMPSSWFAYAVDYDGDGHKDIWTNRSDALASAGNYLARSGWNAGERWGREVKAGPQFDRRLLQSNEKKSLAEWSRLGLKDQYGNALPVGDGNIRASLVIPDGANGKIYLAYNNFDTIMKWNRSKYFALSVGMLAERIGEARPSGRAASSPRAMNE